MIIQRHKGVALITVMLITALATITAAAIASRQHADIQRTNNIMMLEQAYMALLGAEDAARLILGKFDTNQTDGLGDWWSHPEFDKWSVPAGRFVLGNFHIQDLQGRLNINNLVNANGTQIDQRYLIAFRDIFGQAGLPLELVDAAYDWVDQEPGQYNEGAEDQFYTLLATPYSTSQLDMASVSELFLLRHVNQSGDDDADHVHLERRKLIKTLVNDIDRVNRTYPLFTALPRGSEVNVNTVADYRIYQAIVAGSGGSLSEQNAKAIFEDTRNVTPGQEPPFTSVDAFWQRALGNNNGNNNNNQQNRISVSVDSDYYQFTAEAGTDDFVVYLNTIFRKIDTPNGRDVVVVHRSFSKRGEI